MENKKFIEWFEKLKNAWENLDPHEAANLFSKDVKYCESVFEKPCEDWNRVLKLWLLIQENQKDVSFNFELLAVKDNLAVVNWQVSGTLLPDNRKQDIDGIFVIKLNEEDLCNYFKQWRAFK